VRPWPATAGSRRARSASVCAGSERPQPAGIHRATTPAPLAAGGPGDVPWPTRCRRWSLVLMAPTGGGGSCRSRSSGALNRAPRCPTSYRTCDRRQDGSASSVVIDSGSGRTDTGLIPAGEVTRFGTSPTRHTHRRRPVGRHNLSALCGYPACLQVGQLQSAHAHCAHESPQLAHWHWLWLHVWQVQDEHSQAAQNPWQSPHVHVTHSS
jgi:hypothetical protein